MKASITSFKSLLALLLAGGVAAALAQTPAPTPPIASPGATVSVPDAMVQPVKRKKRHVKVTRTTVHKRTVAKHTHTRSQSQSQSTAADSTAK